MSYCYGLAEKIARLSQWGGGGNFLVQMISTCLPSRRGRGGGDRHPVGRVDTENALSISFFSPLFATVLFKCGEQSFPSKNKKLFRIKDYFVKCKTIMLGKADNCCGNNKNNKQFVLCAN